MAIPRVASVPYVNAIPLVWWFESCAQNSPVKVDYRVPSQLPSLLESKSVDAILVSSIDSIRNPNRTIADHVCIGSHGKVESVKIVCKAPPQQIESLALDASSMTSNHLAQIILAEHYNINPSTNTLPSNPEAMLQQADACVIIGDIGMTTIIPGTTTIDLGEAWTNLTGLPFVWALWTGNESLNPTLAAHLHQAFLNAKSANSFRPELIQYAAEQSGWTSSQVHDYLQNSIRFEFDDSAKKGFELFQSLLLKHKLVEQTHTPKLVSGQTTHIPS